MRQHAAFHEKVVGSDRRCVGEHRVGLGKPVERTVLAQVVAEGGGTQADDRPCAGQHHKVDERLLLRGQSLLILLGQVELFVHNSTRPTVFGELAQRRGHLCGRAVRTAVEGGQQRVVFISVNQERQDK